MGALTFALSNLKEDVTLVARAIDGVPRTGALASEE
jgi:hypothetical protein